MTEHTPLPWRVSSDMHGRMLRILSERHGAVAIDTPFRHDAFDPEGTGRSDHTDEMLEANAKLIVRAVNCHDDLLAALEWAERALAPYSKDPAEGSGMHKIRAAITKARGE